MPIPCTHSTLIPHHRVLERHRVMIRVSEIPCHNRLLIDGSIHGIITKSPSTDATATQTTTTTIVGSATEVQRRCRATYNNNTKVSTLTSTINFKIAMRLYVLINLGGCLCVGLEVRSSAI